MDPIYFAAEASLISLLILSRQRADSKAKMELEVSMLVSMLLGFLASSAAIAAFIPLVLINASKRRSGTGPGFLACWLVADALNLAGIILLGAPVTQKILAAWYALIGTFRSASTTLPSLIASCLQILSCSSSSSCLAMMISRLDLHRERQTSSRFASETRNLAMPP